MRSLLSSYYMENIVKVMLPVNNWWMCIHEALFISIYSLFNSFISLVFDAPNWKRTVRVKGVDVWKHQWLLIIYFLTPEVSEIATETISNHFTCLSLSFIRKPCCSCAEWWSSVALSISQTLMHKLLSSYYMLKKFNKYKCNTAL